MRNRVEVMHGVNLDQLGRRDPAHYGTLTLDGNPTLNLTLAGYKPSGTYRLINYTGTIQGGGSFNLVPPVGSSESFSIDTSVAGQVNLRPHRVTLKPEFSGQIKLFTCALLVIKPNH